METVYLGTNVNVCVTLETSHTPRQWKYQEMGGGQEREECDPDPSGIRTSTWFMQSNMGKYLRLLDFLLLAGS